MRLTVCLSCSTSNICRVLLLPLPIHLSLPTSPKAMYSSPVICLRRSLVIVIFSVETFNLNGLGAIEQIVCAHGRRYIGTYFSTFSAHIMRIRGYLPFDKIMTKGHYFWDRVLREVDQCGYDSQTTVCDPSWSGQFRGALWASEYEEGWLTHDEIRASKGSYLSLRESCMFSVI